MLPLWQADSQLFTVPPTSPLISIAISFFSSCFWLPLYLRPPPPFPPSPPSDSSSTLNISSFLYKLSVYLCRLAHSYCLIVSVSLSDPVTVSKVLMRCYLMLHCLIRCCWRSNFSALITRGQLNAILCWISPCNLAWFLAVWGDVCAVTVNLPLGCLFLQHTTAHLHVKQPTQIYKMSMSAVCFPVLAIFNVCVLVVLLLQCLK